MRNLLLLLNLLALTSGAYGACTDVIALSRLEAVSVRDRSDFERIAKEFCAEYRKDKAKAGSSSLAVTYGKGTLDWGGSQARAEAIFSRTCDASNAEKLNQDAYSNYVETVAPGAYAAYEQCVAAEQSTGLRYSVNAVTAQEISIGAYFQPLVAGSRSQTVRYDASGGVKCSWNGSYGVKTAIAPQTTDVLRCSRATTASKGYVVVYSESAAEKPTTFAWQAYQGETPVNQIAALQERLTRAEGALTTLQNSVVAFDSKACPAGWVEYAPAYGRFVRGLDRGETKQDPDGLREPGSVQASAVGRHTHSVDAPFPYAGAAKNATAFVVGPAGVSYLRIGAKTEQGTAKADGLAPESRPINVALLYCVRK